MAIQKTPTPTNPFTQTPDPTDPNQAAAGGAEDIPEIDLDPSDLGLDPADFQATNTQVDIANGHFANLVDEIDDEKFLEDLGNRVIEGVETDRMTRSSLESTLKLGFENLNPAVGGNQSEPFEGACDITHPLIRENAVKYQAKFSKALLPIEGPARTDIRNTDDPTLTSKALKHQNRFNELLREEMTEFLPNMERLFLYMPLTGTGIKKVYFDAALNRPVSDFIRLEDFVISDLSTDFASSYRYSHLYYRTKNEIKKSILAGTFCDIFEDDDEDESKSTMIGSRPTRSGLGEAEADAFDEPDFGDDTEVFTLIEQYIDLDLSKTPLADADGIARPYVVTVEKESGKVLSIRRNWDEDDDALKTKLINFVNYNFVPSVGFHGMGLFHLLNDFQKSLTAITRSLVDSASFSNLNAGFRKKGIRWVGDQGPLKPGEFRELDTLGSDRLQDVIMPLPFKEPSATLFQLMIELTNQGQKFADNIEQVANESVNYGKVGTTMALLEESQQFFSSIFARVYKSMTIELMLIAKLASTYMSDADLQLDTNGDGKIDIGPATDPNFPSRAHKLALAQAKLNLALQAPAVHDMRQTFVNFYQALGDSDETINAILPSPQQAQPNDPLTDIQMASNGQPIKAFPGQDHDAHIAVKQGFMMNPSNAQNQAMGPTMQALQANIRDHLVAKYVEQVQGVMQQQQLAGEVGQQQAAQQVQQANQSMAQNPSDPEMLYAQAEMTKANAVKDKVHSDSIFKTVSLLNDAAKIDITRTKEANRSTETNAKLHIEAAKVDDSRSSDQSSMLLDHVVDLKKIKNDELKHGSDMAKDDTTPTS